MAFINDMPEHVISKCRRFADYSIIYRWVKFNADCDELQQDHNSLHEWETLWKMSFNPSKCHIMHVTKKRKPKLRDYTMKGQTVSTVDTGRAIIRPHLEQTSGKSDSKSQPNPGHHQMSHTSTDAKAVAYKTLIWSQMEYSAFITDPPHRY